MTPSDTGRYVLYTDGGSRGNPGPAASGVVLFDAQGREVCSGGRFLGVATNNVAEYDGLVWGLDVAIARGCRRLEVRMDSELIVRQMTGRYRVKNANLKPLYAKACALASKLDEVRFVHVRREDNTIADSLANEAMDLRGSVGDADADAGGVPEQDSLF